MTIIEVIISSVMGIAFALLLINIVQSFDEPMMEPTCIEGKLGYPRTNYFELVSDENGNPVNCVSVEKF